MGWSRECGVPTVARMTGHDLFALSPACVSERCPCMSLTHSVGGKARKHASNHPSQHCVCSNWFAAFCRVSQHFFRRSSTSLAVSKEGLDTTAPDAPFPPSPPPPLPPPLFFFLLCFFALAFFRPVGFHFPAVALTCVLDSTFCSSTTAPSFPPSSPVADVRSLSPPPACCICLTSARARSSFATLR